MTAPKLYKQYFIDKDDERSMMFELLLEKYGCESGIYPGSFVHITPSLYIKEMAYLDSDRRIEKFFSDPTVAEYVDSRKAYSEEAVINGYQADYSLDLPIEEGQFDIMFSFYAGFISQQCKKYLKPGGILVANNSHGDSSLAAVDEDYEFIAVIKRNGRRFSISEKELDSFFIKKNGTAIDREKVIKTMTGEGFTKTAFAYVFRLIRQ